MSKGENMVRLIFMRNPIRQTLFLLIRCYRATVPFFRNALGVHSSCIYLPSCSEYMEQAIARLGILQGIWAGLKRVGRCRPLKEGGYDPVVKHAGGE